MTSILLHAPLHRFAVEHGPAAVALSLAEQLGAPLTALLFDYPQAGRPEGDRAGARSMLEGEAAARGVSLRAVTEHSHAIGIHEVVAGEARLRSLVVAGTDPEGLLSERQVTEHLLFQSGRPVLIVPPNATHVDLTTIAIAWDGGRCAARALGDAEPLIDRAQHSHLLRLIGDKEIYDSLSLDETAAALGERGWSIEAREVARGQRGSGQALAEEAIAVGAGLLVMGAHSRGSLRERLFGGATMDVIERPLLPTLLSHG